MALPPTSRDEFREEADHVVVGRVAAVYETDVRRDDRAGWVDTKYCIEIDVESVERGGAGPGRPPLLYAHAWSARDRPGPDWAGPGGHRGLPGAGDRVRLYLREDDRGRLHVLEPNGCEAM